MDMVALAELEQKDNEELFYIKDMGFSELYSKDPSTYYTATNEICADVQRTQKKQEVFRK